MLKFSNNAIPCSMCACVTNNSQDYSYTLSIYFPNDTTFCDLHIFTYICKTKLIRNPMK